MGSPMGAAELHPAQVLLVQALVALRSHREEAAHALAACAQGPARDRLLYRHLRTVVAHFLAKQGDAHLHSRLAVRVLLAFVRGSTDAQHSLALPAVLKVRGILTSAMQTSLGDCSTCRHYRWTVSSASRALCAAVRMRSTPWPCQRVDGALCWLRMLPCIKVLPCIKHLLPCIETHLLVHQNCERWTGVTDVFDTLSPQYLSSHRALTAQPVTGYKCFKCRLIYPRQGAWHGHTWHVLMCLNQDSLTQWQFDPVHLVLFAWCSDCNITDIIRVQQC